MSAFTQARRQRIIDDYLSQSKRNVFKPGEFIDWLADKPEHEAYNAFYALDDAEAARAHRIELARRFVSGLRIAVTEHETAGESRGVSVTNRDAPMFISPMDGRAGGGGYIAFDPNDEASRQMFRQEALATFRSWERRYGCALEDTELRAVARLLVMLEKKVVPA